MQVIRHNQAGFTLTEVVVVMLILGLLTLITGNLVSDAMETRERSMTMSHHYTQVGRAMNRITQDLQSAFVSEHRDCDDPRQLSIFRSSSSSGGERLDFSAYSAYRTQADQKRSDQSELAYFVGNDPAELTEKKVLLRRQDTLDDEPEEGGRLATLAVGVKSLDFSFYDPKEDRWDDEWDTSNTEYRGRLPKFVRVELLVEGLDGEDERFVTKTRVFLERVTPITGVGFRQCPDPV